MDAHNDEELRKKVLKNIQEHVPSWKAIISHDIIHITRLSGLSNACYRVRVSPDFDDANFSEEFKGLQPQALLYRVFECPIVDWSQENQLFKSLSDQGIGPKLYFQDSEYRIEGFFLSRPFTIWEMRNEALLEIYAEKICEFNYNELARETMKKFAPMTKLYVDESIDVWGPELEARIPSIREAQRNHPEVLKILDEFEKTFLFPGYKEYFHSLVPVDSEVVLAHNDTQENNILISIEDNTHIILIDFEYTNWNPRAMDLANYINETMLDNAYHFANGIKLYKCNLMNDREQEFLMKKYLTIFYEKYYKGDKTQISLEQYLELEIPKLKEEVKKCLLLNNFFWGVWSLKMIKEDKIDDDKVYNYDFADFRMQMYSYMKELYF